MDNKDTWWRLKLWIRCIIHVAKIYKEMILIKWAISVQKYCDDDEVSLSATRFLIDMRNNNQFLQCLPQCVQAVFAVCPLCFLPYPGCFCSMHMSALFQVPEVQTPLASSLSACKLSSHWSGQQGFFVSFWFYCFIRFFGFFYFLFIYLLQHRTILTILLLRLLTIIDYLLTNNENMVSNVV